MIRNGNTGLYLSAGYGDALTEKDALEKAFAECFIDKRYIISFSSAVLDGYTAYRETPKLKDKVILPVCYTSFTSNSPGSIISACIGIGITLHPCTSALIETFSGLCSQKDAALEVERSLKVSAEQRDLELKDLRFKCVEHKVVECGAVVALCPFFRKEMELNGSMA